MYIYGKHNDPLLEFLRYAGIFLAGKFSHVGCEQIPTKNEVANRRSCIGRCHCITTWFLYSLAHHLA